MPSAFHSQFRRTGAPSLMHQFGEDGCYYDNGGSVGRSIRVIVERSEELAEDGIAKVITCKVIDDCTLGVSATKINDGRDEIAIALVVGGPLVRRQVTRMTDDSNGFVRFRVR